jgi:hypothetical protein
MSGKSGAVSVTLNAVRAGVQEDIVRAMEGIVCDADRRVIDEAPAAYKDLTQARLRRVPAAPVGVPTQTPALLVHCPCLLLRPVGSLPVLACHSRHAGAASCASLAVHAWSATSSGDQG